MKKQRYIVEIEMPDGDMVSAQWLKDIIQTDCDVEDESRKKVTVQETFLASNLDEAAHNHAANNGGRWLTDDIGIKCFAFNPQEVKDAFKAGAEWMASQGLSTDGEVIISHGNKTIEHRSRHGIQETTIPGVDIFDIGDKVVVQIRKK